MRRLVWMGLGAAGAVLLAERARRVAHRYTPAGVTEQVEAAGQRAGSAVQGALTTFRTAFETREKDLVSTLLVQPEGGDARAALRRRHDEDHDDDGYLAGPRDVPSDRGASARAAAGSARPPGRVDDEDGLADF
ncbi:hypothetical protein ICW40_11850 [Actinotalea ferrariae]|uniref:hypothetical protein n=1 Tax=Actinotalea ferrariae TaxID=1386098 RepID=UPI001C8C8CEC|nr:hypothetical protein [Actinotalea ferrariae]MBX9245496.1 hypothetical protein [Actinotalea ferrariae]